MGSPPQVWEGNPGRKSLIDNGWEKIGQRYEICLKESLIPYNLFPVRSPMKKTFVTPVLHREQHLSKLTLGNLCSSNCPVPIYEEE